MAKSNPLFVDSTLLHGDRIGTQIELGKILLYDDESVVLILTNHLNESRHVPMKLGEEGNYQTRVFLSHQKTITFRFVVEKEGRVLLQSAIYHARAQYAILEEWKPVFEEPTVALNPPTTPKAKHSVPTVAEYTRGVASLIEKWGL